VYSLDQQAGGDGSSSSTPSELQITTAREAENGRGLFQTLAPTSRRSAVSKRAAAHHRRKLELYLQHLHAESAITAIKPSCSESTLISRYVSMLGSEPLARQPLSILGTWIQSIPSRIGHNTLVDLAVEFLINSYAVYWDDNYSTRSLARASKEKALKKLQLFVNDGQNKPTYEVLLATKMHYAAEVSLVHLHDKLRILKTNTDRLAWVSTPCITGSMHSALPSCSSLVITSPTWTTTISGT
jgi:hypothetical protein